LDLDAGVGEPARVVRSDDRGDGEVRGVLVLDGHGAEGTLGRMDETALRALPPVDALAAEVDAPRAIALAAARAVLAERRAELRAGADGPADLAGRARAWAAARSAPSLRRVINATG